jgi:hypothetical protein
MFFFKMSRLVLRPIHPSSQWIPGNPTLVVQQLGHDNDHLPSYGAKFMNEGNYTSITSHAFVVCIGTTIPLLYHTEHVNTLFGKMQGFVMLHDRWYIYLLLAVLPVLDNKF